MTITVNRNRPVSIALDARAAVTTPLAPNKARQLLKMCSYQSKSAGANLSNWRLGRTSLFVIGILLAASGCHRLRQHIGPGTIMADRVPYNNAVATSWKEQTLLNIVKLRYAEAPFFVDVPQIVSGYSLDRGASAGIGLQNGQTPGIPSNERFQALLGVSAGFSDRPTIAYSPQTASEFIINLTLPIPPAAVLQLLEAGYAADAVLSLSVQSINGFRNRSASGGKFRPADPEFRQLIEVMRRAQLAGALDIRVEKLRESDESVTMRLAGLASPSDPALAEDILKMNELLGLDEDSDQFSVIYGTTPQQKNQIAIKTRPLYLILNDLTPFVDVPAEDIASGRATAFDTRGVEQRPLQVHCGKEPPQECFAAVPYRGCWFWIDHGHHESKITFSYLLLTLKLADTRPQQAKPTVTIQAN